MPKASLPQRRGIANVPRKIDCGDIPCNAKGEKEFVICVQVRHLFVAASILSSMRHQTTAANHGIPHVLHASSPPLLTEAQNHIRIRNSVQARESL